MAEEKKAAEELGAGKKKEKPAKKKEKKPAKKKGGKRVKEMHVRRASSGGFIAKHDFERPSDMASPMPESEEHVLPDMDALHDHMDEHMGEEGGGEEAAGASPAAAQPAPAGM